MSKKSPFRGLLDNWHGKQAETLFKAEQQKLYHIYWCRWMNGIQVEKLSLSDRKDLKTVC